MLVFHDIFSFFKCQTDRRIIIQVKQHVFFKDINWDTLSRQKVCKGHVWVGYSNGYCCQVIMFQMYSLCLSAIWRLQNNHFCGGRIDFFKKD